MYSRTVGNACEWKHRMHRQIAEARVCAANTWVLLRCQAPREAQAQTFGSRFATEIGSEDPRADNMSSNIFSSTRKFRKWSRKS